MRMGRWSTISTLELLGAFDLSSLMKRVTAAFEELVNVTEVTCWTDSMVVIYWLTQGKDLKQFVRKRVDSIRKKHCWSRDLEALSG